MATASLADARVFAEYDRHNSARWYVLPDGRVMHSRCAGHLEPSIHSAAYIETSLNLTEVAK